MASSLHPNTEETVADVEEYEDIPWSQLAADLAPPRSTTAILGVLLVIVGGLGGYLIARSTGTTAPAAEPSPAVTRPADPPLPADNAAQTTTTTAPTPDPVVAFAEADLMAVAGDDEVRLAELRATWFVRDYFTRDGTGRETEQVAVLNRRHGITVPPSPDVTYVEWVETMAVSPLTPGLYDVTVAFQMLGEGESGLIRHPVRAVTIAVLVDLDGATAVTGLPRPAATGDAVADAPLITPSVPPPAIAQTASTIAAGFGSSPEVRIAWQQDGTWHIVVDVEHGGSRWPLLIDVPPPGDSP